MSFIGMMGPALFAERTGFRVRILQISELPFGGTLYFLVTAGAIIVPATLLGARLLGVRVSRGVLVASIVLAAIATNPFTGSRFLTGSFLVAVGLAALIRSQLSRFIPALAVALLVLIFPTLDVLRGDGTGATQVDILEPAESLQTYDFDAFEMLAREQYVTGTTSARLPDPVALALTPLFRWIPGLGGIYGGENGGAVVARETGMTYTYVSMPLPAEGHLIGGVLGTAALMAALGAWIATQGSPLSRSGHERIYSIFTPPTSALLFILLRGPLGEVFSYALAVALFMLAFRHQVRRDISDGAKTTDLRLLPSSVPPNT